MQRNNEIVSKPVIQEDEISLAKRKEAYESIGIPVERLFYCSGLPMTSN